MDGFRRRRELTGYLWRNYSISREGLVRGLTRPRKISHEKAPFRNDFVDLSAVQPLSSEPGPLARRLMRACRSATIATAMDRDGGRPYAALVTTACAADGSPILLLSQLSEHTRNLKADPRAALLFEAAARRRNPQTGPRVSVIGRISPSSDPADERRFLARHPEAAQYSGFADFSFHRMTVERAHYVGGFARAHWIEAPDFVLPGQSPAAVSEAEEGVLSHMNGDHAEAVGLYASRLLGRKGGGWRLGGIDPDGIDLVSPGGFARLDFDGIAEGPDDLRNLLIGLAAKARQADSSTGP
jgi:putative heme iron utilization protein